MNFPAPQPPHPAEACLQHALAKMEDYVRREPAKAVAATLGAGLLLKLLPTRALARPLSAAATALLPPTLAGLGIIKALELCMQAEARHAANRGRDAQAAVEECDGPLFV